MYIVISLSLLLKLKLCYHSPLVRASSPQPPSHCLTSPPPLAGHRSVPVYLCPLCAFFPREFLFLSCFQFLWCSNARRARLLPHRCISYIHHTKIVFSLFFLLFLIYFYYYYFSLMHFFFRRQFDPLCYIHTHP